jgi:hypothetical protein
MSTNAQALDYSITNELSESEFRAACEQATPGDDGRICADQFMILADQHIAAENAFYEIVLNLESNSKKLNAGGLSVSDISDGNWYATARGYNFNIGELDGFEFSIRLVGADFHFFEKRLNDSAGSALKKNSSVGFHYNYTVRRDGQQIGQGGFWIYQKLGTSVACDDQSNQKKCRKKIVAKYLGENEGRWVRADSDSNPSERAVTLAILRDKGSPFYGRMDFISYKYNGATKEYIGSRKTLSGPYGATRSRDGIVASTGNTEAKSARFSAKAQIAYAKLNIFEEVETAPPPTYVASSTNYAERANSDEQYRYALESCTAQYREENNRNKRGLGSAVGVIGGLFGGSAQQISKVAGASRLAGDVLNTLTSDQKQSVDRCLAERGFAK